MRTVLRRRLPGRDDALAADARLQLVRQLGRLLDEVGGERHGQRRPGHMRAAAGDLAELLVAELAQGLGAELERLEVPHQAQPTEAFCVTSPTTIVAT